MTAQPQTTPPRTGPAGPPYPWAQPGAPAPAPAWQAPPPAQQYAPAPVAPVAPVATPAPPAPAAVPAPAAAAAPQASPALEIDAFLYRCLDKSGSDLHINADTTPWVSAHGATEPIDGMVAALDAADVTRILSDMVTPEQWEAYTKAKRLDFAHVTPRSRFRAHFAKASGAPMAVFRTIPNEVPDFDTLGLPDGVRELADLESGLVLFVGVTGSGKSSSLAALLKLMKNKYARKIITIENPIEYKHSNGKSLIVQREVGVGADVDSFEIGIEDALREAPDVILVGEMRDHETMAAAITAATSGHLVLATLHAESTADAPTRILDSMPADRVSDVRSQLARSLRAVVYQKLLPIKGGGGRALASEVLIMNPAIATMIRDNQLQNIPGQLSVRDTGCIPFERSLLELVRDGRITETVARRSEIRPGSFDKLKDGTSWKG